MTLVAMSVCEQADGLAAERRLKGSLIVRSRECLDGYLDSMAAYVCEV